MKVFNRAYGKIKESAAVEYLEKTLKYKIIECNYSNKIGEIDIIAKDGKVLVFVEVKARETARYGLGREAVDWRKQSKIRQVASLYLQSHHANSSMVRFDVIDILGDNITHISNAF